VSVKAVIRPVSSKVRHFSTLFAHFGLPGYAPGTIAVNVAWIEREFNAGETGVSLTPQGVNTPNFRTTRLRGVLRLKCTKFNLGWGSAPDPAGELTALPHSP